MSNFVSIKDDEDYPKVNVDLLLSVEQITAEEFKHCFLGGLTMILDKDLTQNNE